MKILNKIINVTTTLIIVIGLIFLVLYAVGITPYVVLSGSMEPKVPTGSLCFINVHVKYENIKKGDVIAFKMDDGTLVTHRAVEITDEGIVTKGDANSANDLAVTTASSYVGKNIGSVPYAGYVVKTIQTTKGKVILGTFVVVLFVIGFLMGDPKKKNNKEVLSISDWDILESRHAKKDK
jgi:signal peptidase